MKVVIEGCGWLGNQLGFELQKDGIEVWGNYRSEAGKKKLESHQILPFYHDYDLDSQKSIEIYDKCNVLIIAAPPLWKESPNRYASFLVDIVNQIPENAKVIFTSSIGVYPMKFGSYNEASACSKNDRNQTLLNAEEQLINRLEDRLTILRLGGLIGPNRHPIKFLQGRKMKDDGACPISLIHSGDIINAIRLIIEKNGFGEIFNLVFPTQDSKKEYYSMIAEKLRVEQPEYTIEAAIKREISGELIVGKLGFSYVYDIHNFNDRLS